MNHTNIDWQLSDGRKLTHTWNPITGCKRACPYCYARRNWNRLHRGRTGREFNEITVWYSRFEDRDLWCGEPKVIFVGSMSDPQYWPIEDFVRLVGVCAQYRRNIYMFLSKSEFSYLHPGLIWPSNTMQGLTVTEGGENSMHMIYHLANDVPRPFLSIEPLLGEFTERIPGNMERVIVGAQTGPGAVPVRQEWVDSIKANVLPERLYWKGGKANVQLRRMAGVT